MMNSFVMNGLLSSPEGKTREFKRDLSSPKPLLKTLVAFANTAGGKLVIGMDDDRQIIGVSNPLDDEERLCNLIADSIAPRLVPNVEMVTVEGKTLLVIEVFVSGNRPHWLKSEGAEAGVYVRLGSTSRQADAALIGELRRSVEGVAFDEMPMTDLRLDDLDLDAARQLFSGIGTLDQQALRTLKLLTLHQSQWVPTKGAVLLFGKNRELHFSDAWVQCGRFIGTDKAQIFDHTDIREHLPRAVDSVMLFLKKHAMRGADFSAVRRKDVWNIPLLLLREAVINALVHADYSQIRNHVLARVFRELNLIEQWGSGVRRIFREAQEMGLPEPEFIEIGMRFRVVVFLAERQQLTPAAEQVTEQVTRLIAALKTGPLGVREAMDALGLKHRPTFLSNYLQPALKTGLIQMTQPDSPKSPTQKYRIVKTA